MLLLLACHEHTTFFTYIIKALLLLQEVVAEEIDYKPTPIITFTGEHPHSYK